MKIVEIGKKMKHTMLPAERDELMKKERIKDDKIVEGMFEFLDAQGGWLDFTYRKYPGESVKIITLTHGEIVSLPMGIVKHLNNTKKKVRTYEQKDIGEMGKRHDRAFNVISRVRFTPTSVL